MTMNIGSLTADQIIAEAKRWEALVPGSNSDGSVDDPKRLTPWTHAELKVAAAAYTSASGGLVVSSGGTTGRPKLTTVTPNIGIPRILPIWRPLGRGDVLLNLFSVGKMWGAHYFYNLLATHSQSVVAPMGSLHPDEFGEWADTLVEMKINALAGPPNTLARFAESAREYGVELPIRAVIWAGEPMTPGRISSIQSAFPQAGLWGNYAAIENFVMGVSWPECRLGALHLLPEQLLEPDEEGALLTRIGEGWPAPAVRFRLGDQIRAAECPCGNDACFEVVGRADDRFKLHGAIVGIGDLLSRTTQINGVADAQLLVYRDPDTPSAVVSICLRYTGINTDAAAVRANLMRQVEDLDIVNRHTPEAFQVEHVSEVERNPRTNKVIPAVWVDAPR